MQGAHGLGENLDDPHKALELLQSLAASRRTEDAEKVARVLQTQYDDHAEVQTAVGHWHEYRNRPAEAVHCFRKAQKLEPANLAAKYGLVRCLLRDGKAREAQTLVEASPPLTAASDVSLFIDLGRAHQREGNHQAAITALWSALEAAPRLASDNAFRKLVRTSEKQVPGQPSMLKGFSPGQRWFAIVAAAAALLVGVLAYANYHIASHRELHLLNGFDVPLAVQLDEQQPVTVEAHGRAVVPISEGAHHAVVTHGETKLADEAFEVAAPYATRWFTKPVFIYNAAGGAPVAWEQTTYAEKPVDEGLAKVDLRAGLVQFDDVDFVFEEFPATITLENGKPTKRVRVGLVPIRPEQIVMLSPELAPAEDRLAFLERHLRIDPDSRLAVQSYVNYAAEEQQLDRAKKWLSTGLGDLPLRIEWHRMAERLAAGPEEREQLRERYRKLLARDPKNASAMYLLGRIEPTDTSLKLFEQAIEIEPDNPYPWLAQGFLQRTMGDFAAAKISYEKALEHSPDDYELEAILMDLNLALKEYVEVEEELRADLYQDRTQLDRHLLLLQVLAAQGKMAEARKANQEFIGLATSEPDEFLPNSVGLAWAMLHYLEQNFEAVVEDANEYSFEGGEARLRYQAQLEMGQLEVAGENLSSAGGDAFDYLQMAIAHRLRGNQAGFQKWYELACSELEQMGDDAPRAAELLKRPELVNLLAVQDIQIDPSPKTVLLIALAQGQPPEKRADLLSLAERLNYSLGANHWFRKRAIEALRNPPQKPAG